MDLSKISNLLKQKRKELGITQEELAQKLFVTEKAISRWETGRGTPDISLLIPLSEVLNIEISELLNGEENKNEVEQLIEYEKINKSNKFNTHFKLTILLYILSIFLFLFYLRLEYNSSIEVNYFIRLLIMIMASICIILGNKIYNDNYVEKIEDKKKVTKFSQIIVFIYYIILLFNMVLFARYHHIESINLIPLKTIIEILKNGNLYSIIINIFGNLFIFMPLEYFLMELFKVKKFTMNFMLSLGIISIIEITQFIFQIGVADVDDLILCTSGMIIFYFIYNNMWKKYKIKKAKGVSTIKCDN